MAFCHREPKFLKVEYHLQALSVVSCQLLQPLCPQTECLQHWLRLTPSDSYVICGWSLWRSNLDYLMWIILFQLCQWTSRTVTHTFTSCLGRKHSEIRFTVLHFLLRATKIHRIYDIILHAEHSEECSACKNLK